MNATIQQLRKHLKQQRLQVSPELRQRATEKIVSILLQLDHFQHAQHIACYMDVAGEISTHAILQQIWALGKCCYLPCLAESLPAHLQFAHYSATTPLHPNRYKIPEPDRTQTHLYPAEQLDCVLLPLLAFDGYGNRLGMGAGYYDRTFAFNKDRLPPIPLIGIAYAFQYQEHFPVHPWDVPLQGVITENGYQSFTESL